MRKIPHLKKGWASSTVTYIHCSARVLKLFIKSSRISDPLRKLNVPTKKGMCSYCVQTVLTAFLQLETSNGVSKNLLVSAQQDCKATIFISSRTRVVYL